VGHEWHPQIVKEMLRCRAIDVQLNLDSAERMASESPAYEFLYDMYLAQFYGLNHLWMGERYLTSKASLIERLHAMLADPVEPTPDILDLGRYIAYRGVVLKSLIDEFESLIYR